MPARPVAKQILNASTSTGTFTAFFGTGHRYASLYLSNASTKTLVHSMEASAGDSNIWLTILAVTSSTGTTARTSTGGLVFDKIRLNVSANNTTAGVDAWLAVSV